MTLEELLAAAMQKAEGLTLCQTHDGRWQASLKVGPAAFRVFVNASPVLAVTAALGSAWALDDGAPPEVAVSPLGGASATVANDIFG